VKYKTIAYIFVAYLFVFLFHLYWVYWASDIKEFLWHGQLMINNVDGYFYGSAAQKIVSNLHEYNPRLQDVWQYGTAVITAYLAKFLHIDIDTLMLYLPAIISSLVVIPIILIGRLYNNELWGFLSALIAGIGWSYYNRTLAGYYDTDMFSASLPMFILYFLLYSIKNKNLTFTLFAGLLVIIYPWVYDQGLSIVYAMGIIAFIYMILFNKDEFTYKFILLFSVALMDINPIFRAILVVVLYFILRKYNNKYIKYFSFIAFLLFLITGNVFGIILHKVLSYSTKTTTIEGLKFLNVNTTVSEASAIPWNIIFNRIVGSSIGIVIAIIGYLMLLKRHKEFIIALPLWGIGFFAFVGGLRFTVYAVPIAAMSGVYFFFVLSEYVKNRYYKLAIVVLGSLFLIAPNIAHIIGCCEKNKFLAKIEKIYPLKSYPYLVPTTFKASEVAVLDKLKNISNPKDYVITWWDYGYPIWYYANVNTLIDGGKHNEDNFLVSKILSTSNAYLARNLSLLSIKKYIETNKTVAPQLFVKNNRVIHVEDYLSKVGEKNYLVTKPDRDVYIMLPHRMLKIFGTVVAFSNRNLNTGEVYKDRFRFFYIDKVRKIGNNFYVGRYPIDLRRGLFILGRNAIPLKEVVVVGYTNDNETIIKKTKLRSQGLIMVFLKSYGEAIVMDDDYYNSLFIQMFVLDNYNKDLFEKTIDNPWIKVFKIK